MTPLDKAKVLSHPCPKCGAQPGERCRSKDGREYTRTYIHTHRMAVLDPDLLRPRRGFRRLDQDS